MKKIQEITQNQWESLKFKIEIGGPNIKITSDYLGSELLKYIPWYRIGLLRFVEEGLEDIKSRIETHDQNFDQKLIVSIYNTTIGQDLTNLVPLFEKISNLEGLEIVCSGINSMNGLVSLTQKYLNLRPLIIIPSINDIVEYSDLETAINNGSLKKLERLEFSIDGTGEDHDLSFIVQGIKDGKLPNLNYLSLYPTNYR